MRAFLRHEELMSGVWIAVTSSKIKMGSQVLSDVEKALKIRRRLWRTGVEWWLLMRATNAE
jgi:hypothetical protein